MCCRRFPASRGPDVIAILLFGNEGNFQLVERNSSALRNVVTVGVRL